MIIFLKNVCKQISKNFCLLYFFYFETPKASVQTGNFDLKNVKTSPLDYLFIKIFKNLLFIN